MTAPMVAHGQLTDEEYLGELQWHARSTLAAGVESVSDDHATAHLREVIDLLHPDPGSLDALAQHWRTVALALTETAARLSVIASIAQARPEHRDHHLERLDVAPPGEPFAGWRPSSRTY